jgi:hypothetical protein
MRLSIIKGFLIVSAAVLLAVNVKMWQVRPAGGETSSSRAPQSSGSIVQSSPRAPAAEQQRPEASPQNEPIPTIKSRGTTSDSVKSESGFDWAKIETRDYKQYVRNLRAVGFPEELVRDIVIADLDKLYESREAPLKPKLVAYDAPLDQRQTHDISAEDWQRIKDLWQVRQEKQNVLEQILDSYVPREILRTPISRNYEAYEYAISLMPPEKRDAVQLAQETEIIVEGMHKTSISDHAAELEAFKKSRQERDAAMLAVLTPEEFERYEMYTTPAGTELARRIIGMQPTEQEFQTMFRIAYKNWIDTGGVYGRWRAVRVPPQQIAAADQEMNDSMKAALGPDRFLDYQMAISGTGQKLRNFGARFDLPRQTLAEAFDLQTQIDRLSRIKNPNPANPDAPVQTPADQIAPLQTQLQQLFGPPLWQDWEIGRNLQVNLDP